jgi:acyl-CoA synthetase (AMP-forming)/AMP-acid ligase II
MGRKNMLKCIKSTAPEALIAESEVFWIKKVFKKNFKSVKYQFSHGRFSPPGITRLEGLEAEFIENPERNYTFDNEETKLDDTAAILFTTGSTGPPKGVVVTHRIFIKQTEIIKEVYGAGPEHFDMPAFPLFALFAAALGMPCVLPEMDPTKPAEANPKIIVKTIIDNGVTFSFGSPAFWRTVAKYCVENKIKLPSLRRVLMAGAPVSDELHRLVKSIMADDGETMVPYGCTEALPISNFNGTEMLAETAELTKQGKGFCVGYPIDGMNIRIIESVDEPIDEWQDAKVLPSGQIGEITIKGDVVTPLYYSNPKATLLAKINDTDGNIIHRMGDMGYFDEKGRLWFCGRKSHRVITTDKTYYTVCVEALFNNHPDVFRTAIVPHKTDDNINAVLIVELYDCNLSRKRKDEIKEEFLELASSNELAKGIKTVLFHTKFPVDIRHNAKIFREKLTVWAREQLG